MPIIIDAENKLSFSGYLKKIWNNRNLLLIFAYKNIKGKIAQTRLGVFIILFQAIILTLIFGFFITRFITFSVTYPYILFAITGMMGWYIFSYVAIFSGTSIIQNHQIVSKIYFPRIILPFSYGISALVDFAGWLIVLSALMIYYKIIPSVNFFAIFLFLFIDIIIGLAVGLWISLLSLRNRDVALFAPFIIGIGMFFTPVIYPVKVLPESISYLLFFNPLAGVVEGLRWSLFNTEFDFRFIWGFFIIILVFISGVYLFVKKDENITDKL